MLILFSLTTDFSDQFDQYINLTHYTVVLYMEHDCSYCDNPGLIFRDVQLYFDKRDDILLGLASCSKNNNICISQNVNQIPQLIFYEDGFRKAIYLGPWNVQVLIEWVLLNTGELIIQKSDNKNISQQQ